MSNKDNRLYFKAPKNTFIIPGDTSEGTLLFSGDLIENTGVEDEFYFYGQNVKFIRVDHVRMNTDEFIAFVKSKTALSNFRLEFKNLNGMDFPILLVKNSDYTQAKNFIESYTIEITLDILQEML